MQVLLIGSAILAASVLLFNSGCKTADSSKVSNLDDGDEEISSMSCGVFKDSTDTAFVFEHSSRKLTWEQDAAKTFSMPKALFKNYTFNDDDRGAFFCWGFNLTLRGGPQPIESKAVKRFSNPRDIERLACGEFYGPAGSAGGLKINSSGEVFPPGSGAEIKVNDDATFLIFRAGTPFEVETACLMVHDYNNLMEHYEKTGVDHLQRFEVHARTIDVCQVAMKNDKAAQHPCRKTYRTSKPTFIKNSQGDKCELSADGLVEVSGWIQDYKDGFFALELARPIEECSDFTKDSESFYIPATDVTVYL